MSRHASNGLIPAFVTLAEAPASTFLHGLGKRLGRPRAIIVASAHHLRVDQVLAPLRQGDVLIIGSSGFTYDLAHLRRGDPNAKPTRMSWPSLRGWTRHSWSSELTTCSAYQQLASFAERQHPTDEHLLPIYVAMGAGGAPRRLHASTMYANLRMDA